MSTKAATRKDAGHGDDFYAWTQDQAEKLRTRRHKEIDWGNVAEEIDGVGRSDRRRIGSNLNVVLAHLLKWRCRADTRQGGRVASIVEHRHRLRRIIDDSPSLASYPAEVLAAEYAGAHRFVAVEAALPLALLPERCPFAIAEVLDAHYPADLDEGSGE